MRQVLCPVLVSRDEEVSQLTAALTAAQSGRGGTVLVTGEAGIGKSRLVRETVHLARELITYRAIGGRASTSWFVLTYLLGRDAVRVYDGSWAEWGRLPGTPVETA